MTNSPAKDLVLRGISDVRRFFYRNDGPIFFISATNFNLIGIDEWGCVQATEELWKVYLGPLQLGLIDTTKIELGLIRTE